MIAVMYVRCFHGLAGNYLPAPAAVTHLRASRYLGAVKVAMHALLVHHVDRKCKNVPRRNGVERLRLR